MLNPPVVSVITPCLNPGWRLKRCLASIAAQHHDRVEHIVVDAQSTDGTVDLLESTPGIQWVSEPDDGQTDAIRKGFEMASGELLTWLGADDSLRPDALARVVDALGAEPDAGWAFGDVAVADPARPYVWRPPATVVPDDFGVGCPVAQPGTVIRRAALDAIGGLDRSLHFAMDLDLWLRLTTAGIRGVRVPGVLADFEVHPSSKGGSGDYARFLHEAAHIRMRHGLADAAMATAGRVAAHRAAANGGLAAGTIEHELVPLLAELGGDPGAAWASARAESALLSWPRHPVAAARWLGSPGVWSDRHARRLVLLAARTTARSVLGKDPALD